MTVLPSDVDALHLRKVYGPARWAVPQRHGPNGWSMSRRDGTGSIIVSAAWFDDGPAPGDYLHASIAWDDRMPTYEDLVTLHRAVWRDRGWAIQVFAPPTDHVNIHPFALHLYGRLDGRRIHPDFAPAGTI